MTTFLHNLTNTTRKHGFDGRGDDGLPSREIPHRLQRKDLGPPTFPVRSIALAASFRALMLVVLLVIVAPSYGILGVAYVVAGMTCVMTLADYALAPRLLGIDVRRLLAAIWRPVTAALLMAAAVGLLRAGIALANDLSGHAWSMVTSVLLGAAVYVASIWALWIIGGRRDGSEQRLIALARDYRARHARNAR